MRQNLQAGRRFVIGRAPNTTRLGDVAYSSGSGHWRLRADRQAGLRRPSELTPQSSLGRTAGSDLVSVATVSLGVAASGELAVAVSAVALEGRLFCCFTAGRELAGIN